VEKLTDEKEGLTPFFVTHILDGPRAALDEITCLSCQRISTRERLLIEAFTKLTPPIAIVLLTCAALAQSPPAFEVATVKPDKSGDRATGGPLDPERLTVTRPGRILLIIVGSSLLTLLRLRLRTAGDG
jgi:hypothetical protein